MSDIETSAAVTAAAAAIVDVWMGGDQSWRSRMDKSEFLDSADWHMAMILARAALRAVETTEAHNR